VLSAPPSPRPRPALWPPLFAFVAALLLVLTLTTGLVLAVGAVRAAGEPAQIGPQVARFAASAAGIMSAATLSAAVLVLTAIVAAALDPRAGSAPLADRLHLGRSRASVLGTAAGVVGMIGLGMLAGTASDLLGARRASGPLPQIAEALSHLGGLGSAGFWLALLTIAIAPGIAEETFFRGYLLPRFSARWGLRGGIAASATAFGLMHLDPVQGTIALVAGVYLGWLAETQRAAGRQPQALETIDRALSINPEELFFLPELLRIRGDIRGQTNRRDLAEADLREAIARSVAMGAKMYQLRSAISLFRLLGDDGDAREQLATIYASLIGERAAELDDAARLLSRG